MRSNDIKRKITSLEERVKALEGLFEALRVETNARFEQADSEQAGKAAD